MINSNVMPMQTFRELREAQNMQKAYKRYLLTLGNTQLESEIYFLLDQFSLDAYGKDFFYKVRMVQTELVSRADTDWKHKISALNQETLHLL